MFLFLHAQDAVLHKYVLARTLVPQPGVAPACLLLLGSTSCFEPASIERFENLSQALEMQQGSSCLRQEGSGVAGVPAK